jgi:hypothetical protein
LYGKLILLKNSSQTEADKSIDTNNLKNKIQKLEEILEQQRIDLNHMRRMVNNMRGTTEDDD